MMFLKPRLSGSTFTVSSCKLDSRSGDFPSLDGIFDQHLSEPEASFKFHYEEFLIILKNRR
jgi:hypothetical protein